MLDIHKEIGELESELIHLRERFHQYPELACREKKTTEMIIEELIRLHIPYERLEPTGVVGYLGKRRGKTVALRADIDGLAVTEETGLSFQSKISGQMHACGHDGHITGLLGAAAVLKKYEEHLDGWVKLIFQPAEENSKGANLVISQGIMEDVDEIFGVHIFSDLESGRISIDSGPRMAATDHFTITLTGRAGHAAKPHQCIDTTVVAAALVMNLQTIVSRRMNPIEDAVLTVGRLESGTAYNVISGKAVLEGTVRTFSVETEQMIKESIIQVAKDTAKLYGAKAVVDYPPSTHPPLINDLEIARRVYEGAKKVFLPENLKPVPQIMLGEDFANYLIKTKGAFAFVGGGKTSKGKQYPNHHNRFDFDNEALLNASKIYIIYIINTIWC
ncbi:MAG: amidohydrolase [Anaerostipes sp.]|nr:amidohydrolase [Anaerostipes sp.]